MHYKLFFGFVIVLSVVGCNIINPEEQIPSYIHLEPFTFVAGPDDGGSTSKITEAWVYVGGDLLGAYTLPATFPVLQSGTVEVLCDPGIYDNGRKVTPELYPFYRRYTTSVTLVTGDTVTISPTTGYDPNTADFKFIETFESSNSLTIDMDANAATFVSLVDNPTEVREGTRSGVMVLNADNKVGEVAAALETSLPRTNTPIYIEMDYRSDANFLVGLNGVNSDGTQDRLYHDVEFFPRPEWNKLYINMTDYIQPADKEYDAYRVIILAALDADHTSGNIYLDNIKLISLKQ